MNKNTKPTPPPLFPPGSNAKGGNDLKKSQRNQSSSAQAAPVQQPAQAAPVQQPAQAAPVQQPAQAVYSDPTVVKEGEAILPAPEEFKQQVQGYRKANPATSKDFNPFDPFGLSSLDSYYSQQAAPVQQPDQAAPVQQPAQAAPVQQPAQAAPIQQPVQAAPIQQPVQAAPVKQPEIVTQPYNQAEPQPVLKQDPQNKQDQKPSANFRIGDHVKISDSVQIPPNELHFNQKEFLTLLAASVSLKKHEKLDIINRIPKLKQFQINELMRIFKSESDKFAELPKEHTPYLEKLVKEKQAEWESIEDQFVMEGAKDSEKNQADEIRKQLGL